MPGMFGAFGFASSPADLRFLRKSVDLLDNCEGEFVREEAGFLGEAHLPRGPMRGPRLHRTSRFTAVFAGDLIERQTVPWEGILEAIAEGKSAFLRELEGRYALAAYDRVRRRVHLVSDRRSQYPLYVFEDADRIAFSSAHAFFVRLLENPTLDPAWVQETIFFASAVGATSLLRGVQRMPPASILALDVATGRRTVSEWAPPRPRSTTLLRGRAALEECRDVLADRIPRYYSTEGRNAVSLTSGLDSRTVLALAPSGLRHAPLTYTYGNPGCRDLLHGAEISRRLEFTHRALPFDAPFVARLPELIYRTVWLADGLTGLQRAAVCHAYERLASGENPPEVAITGVFGDAVFRGSTGVPAGISAAAAEVFRRGRLVPERGGEFDRVFGRSADAFWERTQRSVNWIASTYGPLDSGETHTAFMISDFAATRYFEGEARIAEHFLGYRVPYWDRRIIEHGFRSEYSTLTLSGFLPGGKDPLVRNVAQCHLLTSIPSVAGIPLKGIPVEVYAQERKWRFHAERLMRTARRRLRRKADLPLENWPVWLRGPAGQELRRLLEGEPRISAFIDGAFIRETLATGDLAWTRRLATLEIIARLVANRWDLEKVRRESGSLATSDVA